MYIPKIGDVGICQGDNAFKGATFKVIKVTKDSGDCIIRVFYLTKYNHEDTWWLNTLHSEKGLNVKWIKKGDYKGYLPRWF